MPGCSEGQDAQSETDGRHHWCLGMTGDKDDPAIWLRHDTQVWGILCGLECGDKRNVRHLFHYIGDVAG